MDRPGVQRIYRRYDNSVNNRTRAIRLLHRYGRGFSKWFIDMKGNPEFYHAFANKMLKHGIDQAEIYLNAVGDYMDRINAGPGDMGTQSGPTLSLEDFREFILSYQIESFKLIRK